MAMPIRLSAVVAAIQFMIAALVVSADGNAQSGPRRLAVKNDESIEIGLVYYVVNCRSIMIGMPELEMLEGPPEVKLSIREEPVLPRVQGCAAKVPGGTMILTAKGVKDKVEMKMTYRLKYKTKDGERQTSGSYIVSLFP
jgi:hypothetical protein